MATGVGDISLAGLTLSATAGAESANFHEGDITLSSITLSGSLQGPNPLPEFTLSATGVAGAIAEGDPFLPTASLSGASVVGSTGVGAAILPGFELDASTGTRGNAALPHLTLFGTGLAGTTSKSRTRVIAGVTISETQPTLPKLTLSGTAISQRVLTGDAALLPLELAGTAISGASGAGEIVLREPRLTAAGLSGTAPAGDITLPGFTLSATTADGAVASGAITLPELTLAGIAPLQPQPRTGAGDAVLDAATLAGTMLSGAIATGSLSLREPEVEGILANSAPMSGDIQLAEFTLVAQGLGSNAAVGSVRLDELALAATAVSGSVSTAVIEIPLVTLSAQDGVLEVVGTASIALPAFLMAAVGSGSGGQAIQLDSPSYLGVSLNTRTRAVSTYDGLAPNSLASFNGVTLMATADGIVALASRDTADHHGALVDAYLTTGTTDFHKPDFKRVLTGYVGYRAGGDMELTLITDGHHEYAYTLAPRRVEDQQHASRVKFGRGVAGVYWQCKVANVDGCDFALDRIELLTASTGAKV